MSLSLGEIDRLLRAEARVAELEAELAAWRGQTADAAKMEARATREVAIARRLRPHMRGASAGHSPMVARAAMLLIDNPGRLWDRERFGLGVALSDEIENPTRLAGVTLCWLRAALREMGVDAPIRTVWGYGYEIDAGAAAALRQALEPGP